MDKEKDLVVAAFKEDLLHEIHALEEKIKYLKEIRKRKAEKLRPLHEELS